MSLTGIRELYELQGMDTEIDRRLRRISQIDKELQENEQLVAARKDLEAKETLLRQAVEEQKTVEESAESTRARIAAHESRMYGGETINSKELQNITADVSHLKERQAALDAQVLGLMEQTDRARAETEQQKTVVKEVQTALLSAQAHLLEEKNRLEADLPEWKNRRNQFASTIPPAMLRTYEHLRTTKGGVAVARVDRGICGGCRIAVPTTLSQRARTGKYLVYCTSCARLLYAT